MCLCVHTRVRVHVQMCNIRHKLDLVLVRNSPLCS